MSSVYTNVSLSDASFPSDASLASLGSGGLSVSAGGKSSVKISNSSKGNNANGGLSLEVSVGNMLGKSGSMNWWLLALFTILSLGLLTASAMFASKYSSNGGMVNLVVSLVALVLALASVLMLLYVAGWNVFAMF